MKTEIELLEDKIEKLSRKVFGMEQTLKHLQEKEAKRYEYANGIYNPDSNYVNKYHKGDR